MQNYEWLSQGENIIYEAVANKQWNVKGINLPGNKGGHLILTDKHLVFQSNTINLGTKIDKIPLSNITNVDKGFHPLTPTPNMIKVETTLGEKYMFIVTGKDMEKWLEIIPQAVKKCSNVPQCNHTATKDNIYKCQNCGYSANKPFKFCAECGKEYIETVNHCPNCGTVYNEGQKFCLECGTSLI